MCVSACVCVCECVCVCVCVCVVVFLLDIARRSVIRLQKSASVDWATSY